MTTSSMTITSAQPRQAALNAIAEDMSRALQSGFAAVWRKLLEAARGVREYFTSLLEATRIVCRKMLELLREREVRDDLLRVLSLALQLYIVFHAGPVC